MEFRVPPLGGPEDEHNSQVNFGVRRQVLNPTRISSFEDGTHRLAGRAGVNEPLTHLWGRGIAPVPMSSHRR